MGEEAQPVTPATPAVTRWIEAHTATLQAQRTEADCWQELTSEQKKEATRWVVQQITG